MGLDDPRAENASLKDQNLVTACYVVSLALGKIPQ